MDETANLKLPYILAAQSQKHVTHNEALRALDAIVQLAVADKDLSTPPGSPAEGARYIVGASPTGAWSGHATHVAAWQDGAWAFYAPAAGWLAWVADESQSYLFAGGGWTPAPGGSGGSLVPKGAWDSVTTYTTGDLVEHEGYVFLSNINDNLDNEPDAVTPGSSSEWTYFSVVTGGGGGGGEGGGSVNPVSLVGVNATADTTNRLSVASPASLFSHEGAGHQLKINKDAAGDTASVLFQTDFSGRAEFGLAGDDDFHVKVSADGSTWHEALVIDRASGAVRAAGLREVLSANRTYYVRTDGSDGNTGLANTSGGAFATIQKAIDAATGLDLNVYSVTIQVANGTYTGGNTLKSYVGVGPITIQGNTTTPANVLVSTGSAHSFFGSGVIGKWVLKGMKTVTSAAYHFHFKAGTIVDFDRWDFGACPSYYHIECDTQSVVSCVGGSYSITGGAAVHWRVAEHAEVRVFSTTITLSGTPAFATAFADVSYGSEIISNATFSGSATGKRYQVTVNSWIETFGGGANYFPGNSAGSTATGGQYL